MLSGMEEWRRVPGLKYYEASNLGGVRSQRKSKIKTTKQFTRPDGRLVVNTYVDGKYKQYLAHRLVLLAFVGKPGIGEEACHNNGNPSDNRIENLRWGSHSSNGLDTVKHGTNSRSNKTRCPSGHPYEGLNLLLTKDGRRQCVTCRSTRDALRSSKTRGLNKTHCLRGHEYSQDRDYTTNNGWRSCDVCQSKSSSLM